MNAWHLQTAIMAPRYLRSFVLPNHHVPGWAEADVFEVTKAGYFREYEIKTSVSDFKKDSTKTVWAGKYDIREHQGRTFSYRKDETKHSLLSQGYEKGPVQFWFVVPIGLLENQEIPEWAGLIEVRLKHQNEDDLNRYRPWNLLTSETKKAPRLHKAKYPEKKMQRARESCYYRLHKYY